MPRIVRRAPSEAERSSLAPKHAGPSPGGRIERKKSISVASSTASPFRRATPPAARKKAGAILPYVLMGDCAWRENLAWKRAEGHEDLWLPIQEAWQIMCSLEERSGAQRNPVQDASESSDGGGQPSRVDRPTIGFSNDGTWMELDADGKTWKPMQRLPAFLSPEAGKPDAGKADAAPSPAPKPRPSDDFGIPEEKVVHRRAMGQFDFDLYLRATLKRQYRIKHSRHYERVPRNYTKADGSRGTEYIYARRADAPTRAMRFYRWQAGVGKKIERNAKMAARIAREVFGLPPRKTGSTYAEDSAKEDLLNNTKQIPFDNAFAVQSSLKLGATGAYGATVLASPGDAAEVGALTDLVSGTSEVQAPFDAMFAGEAYLRSVFVAREANKAKLEHFGNAARARASLASCTPEEARAYLSFMDGAKALFSTPEDVGAVLNAAWGRFVRMGILQPISSSTSLGVEVANSVLSNPLLGLATLGPSTATNVFDVFEGKNEFLRFAIQVEKAEARKAAMQKLLMDVDTIRHPDYSLLKGIVQSLIAHQDQLIKRGELEMIFALVHAIKGGAVIGCNFAALVAAVGITVGLGAATLAATGPFAAIPAAILLAIWAAVLAARNEMRVSDLHDSKWDKRAMTNARYDGLTREALEAKLSSREADERMVKVHQQEGEYLPEKARFAGDRTIEFDVRENVYAGLEALSFKVQDLVKESDYDARSPFMKLVHALEVDELELLMVCKAVSDKSLDNAQRDAIESYLSPRAGVVARPQAAPHVSLFIEQFRAEWDEVDRKLPLNAGVADQQSRFFEAVRARLLTRYGDDEARLQDFARTVGEFLNKTRALSRRNLDPADGYLEPFVAYLVSRQAPAPGAAPMRQPASMAVQRPEAAPRNSPAVPEAMEKKTAEGVLPPQVNKPGAQAQQPQDPAPGRGSDREGVEKNKVELAYERILAEQAARRERIERRYRYPVPRNPAPVR